MYIWLALITLSKFQNFNDTGNYPHGSVIVLIQLLLLIARNDT